jgi:hypothetical protein
MDSDEIRRRLNFNKMQFDNFKVCFGAKSCLSALTIDQDITLAVHQEFRDNADLRWSDIDTIWMDVPEEERVGAIAEATRRCQISFEQQATSPTFQFCLERRLYLVRRAWVTAEKVKREKKARREQVVVSASTAESTTERAEDAKGEQVVASASTAESRTKAFFDPVRDK